MQGMWATLVLAITAAVAQADAGNPLDNPLDYNEETYPNPHIPLSVESFFAVLFVLLIASVPLVLVKLKQGELTNAHIAESVLLIVWLTVTLFLFTNVLKFASGHWEGARPLTLVEAVYLLAQVLTTVGYGDITPAFPRGQVWLAINVLLALCLYGSIIMEVTELVQERIAVYLAEKAKAREEARRRESSATASGREFVSADGSSVPSLRDWKVEADIDAGPLMKSFMAFLVFAGIGVLFWHFYPGEEKTWLQAIYMSVITLSTVGFGWFNATTEGGKVFGAFWMMFGVAALAATLTNFVELMFKLKEAERMSEDSEKLFFFKILDNYSKTKGDGKSIGERSMCKHEFIKFGLLLTKQATEEELQAIEERFEALGPKDGLLTRKQIEEAEAPSS